MASEAPTATILIVDDDAGLSRLLQKTLQRAGYTTATAASGKDAIKWLMQNRADLMLLDLKLQDIEGKELVNHLAATQRTVPFAIITGQGDERVAVDMMKSGALDYLVKDVNFIEFVPTIVRRALERLAKEKMLVEAQEAREQAEGQVAADLDAMTRLQRLGALFVRDGEMEPILVEIVDAAMAIARSDFGSIQLVNAAGNLEIVAQRGFPPWWVQFWNNDSKNQRACSKAVEVGQRIIVEDVERCSIFVGTPGLEILLRAGVRAVQSTPLVDRSGKLLGIFSTHCKAPHRPDDRTLGLLDLLARQAADIIDRQQREAALRETEARYRALVMASSETVYQMSADWKEMHRLVGRDFIADTEGPSRMWLDKYIFPEDQAQVMAAIDEAIRTKSLFQLEHRVRRVDGSAGWTLSRAVPILDATGEITDWFGMASDITERKKLEQALVDVTEREQRKFGHELHDGLGQRLTGLEMLSHALAEDLSAHAEDLAKQARRLNSELRETVAEARLISHSLAPVQLDGDGLMRGLSELASRTSRHKGVKCRFLCEPPVVVEDQMVATHLYRIAQEAVTNAIKHGRARMIDIRLTESVGALNLCVENNGHPLPVKDQSRNGVGLNAMRYRVGLIGGALAIDSGKRRGVKVSCTLRRKT